MNKTEFETELTQIRDRIREIENIMTKISNEMIKRGHDDDAYSFCIDVSDWFPTFPKTDYVPLTVDEVVGDYANIFDTAV